MGDAEPTPTTETPATAAPEPTPVVALAPEPTPAPAPEGVTQAQVENTAPETPTEPTPVESAPPAPAPTPANPGAEAILEALAPVEVEPGQPVAPSPTLVEVAIDAVVNTGVSARQIAARDAQTTIDNAEALKREGLLSAEEHEMWVALAGSVKRAADTDAEQAGQIAALTTAVSLLSEEVAALAVRLTPTGSPLAIAPGDANAVLRALSAAVKALAELREAGAINARLATLLDEVLNSVAALAGRTAA